MERLQTLQDDLGGVLDFVINDLKSKWKEMSGGPSVFDSLKAFIAAVDWKVRPGGLGAGGCQLQAHPPCLERRPPQLQERWLVGLLSFHALLLLTVIIFRKNWRVQGATFFGIGAPPALGRHRGVLAGRRSVQRPVHHFITRSCSSAHPHPRLRCLAGGIVYNAERINGLAAKHWRAFAGQPYFDGHGIFTSAVLSAPLLLAMFVILINYLLATASLLIKMKRKELQVKARQQRAAGGGAGAQAAAGQQPTAAAAEGKKDK